MMRNSVSANPSAAFELPGESPGTVPADAFVESPGMVLSDSFVESTGADPADAFLIHGRTFGGRTL